MRIGVADSGSGVLYIVSWRRCCWVWGLVVVVAVGFVLRLGEFGRIPG